MNTPLKTQYCRAGVRRGAIRINLKAVNTLVIAVVMLLGTYYLININELSVKGFILKELKSQSSLLETENVELQNKVSSLQSYDNVIARVSGLNMVSVGDMDYVSRNQMAMAR
jgi:hypothetical protein